MILFSRTVIGSVVVPMFKRGVAIVTLTKWGVSTSEKIAKALDKAQIKYNVYAPRELCSPEALAFDKGLDKLFRNLFNDFDAIIAVMAVGIVVRSLASLIVSKKTDPAVVVVDDLGKYAISLLSGHIGGANKLAKIVALGIDAVPVITTATELLGKKCIEEIAEEHNLSVMNIEALTPINSAIVNEKKILVATVGGVACPEIELKNTDLRSMSHIDQLKEMMKEYDAGIVIAPSMVSLKGIAKPIAILTVKRET